MREAAALRFWGPQRRETVRDMQPRNPKIKYMKSTYSSTNNSKEPIRSFKTAELGSQCCCSGDESIHLMFTSVLRTHFYMLLQEEHSQDFHCMLHGIYSNAMVGARNSNYIGTLYNLCHCDIIQSHQTLLKFFHQIFTSWCSPNLKLWLTSICFTRALIV